MTDLKPGDKVLVWGFDDGGCSHSGKEAIVEKAESYILYLKTSLRYFAVHPRQCELVERAKEKPQIIYNFGLRKDTAQFVALTPEVEAALKKEGLL